MSAPDAGDGWAARARAAEDRAACLLTDLHQAQHERDAALARLIELEALGHDGDCCDPDDLDAARRQEHPR